MHTADIHPYVEVVDQKVDLVKQISSDSKESTPPDELLLDIEEVPENIDIADQVLILEMIVYRFSDSKICYRRLRFLQNVKLPLSILILNLIRKINFNWR